MSSASGRDWVSRKQPVHLHACHTPAWIITPGPHKGFHPQRQTAFVGWVASEKLLSEDPLSGGGQQLCLSAEALSHSKAS
jgi:hypothetical protein